MSMGAREKILILRTMWPFQGTLPRTFVNYDVQEIDTLDDAASFPEAKILLTALVLTHAPDLESAGKFIKEAARRFSVVMFYEPSSQPRTYLAALGYKSHHENYQENCLIGEIDLKFFSRIGRETSVYRVEHYGGGATFDIRAPWIVPLDQPGDIDFNELGHRPNHLFEQPVFEMSAFVIRGFNALPFTPGQDLEFIEAKILQPHGRAGGFFLEGFQSPRRLGRALYTTPANPIDLLNYRVIHEPAVIVDEAIYDNDQRAKTLERWRGMFASKWLDLSINELPNCVIGGSGFIFSDGVPVHGSDYLIPYLYTSLYQPIWTGLQRPHPRRHLPGVSIMGFNHLYDNYYHFLAEALNAIALCQQAIENTYIEKVYIITGKLNGVRREYLDILLAGNDRIEIIDLDRDEYVTTDRTLYCDHLLGRSVPQPVLVAERVAFQQKILENSGLLRIDRGDRLIYLSRQDTKARPILNEEALIERLRGLGFEIYLATGKPVREQIQMFREARLVVAGHGAGVSNMLFAREDAALLELIQASYLNVGPMRLTQLSGARYHSQLFFEEGEHNGWYVDIERVVRAIGQLM
ncbi:glycosyltransferase family 61 protein [Gluconacetobacter asukensis]|uniref:Glycosyltransferase family 61 protein n=1 Tax=Gluconacetobacter asukensis TaxID=1017181 RepID=A0A7W4IYH5_9PROT|nr:glycosyltransferase family 61 protein [Gluconacetobacter asukensis]MBB2171351.1 glycosyltransferase family 61 protein [Gluconacetobacter asukensis]